MEVMEDEATTPPISPERWVPFDEPKETKSKSGDFRELYSLSQISELIETISDDTKNKPNEKVESSFIINPESPVSLILKTPTNQKNNSTKTRTPKVLNNSNIPKETTLTSNIENISSSIFSSQRVSNTVNNVYPHNGDSKKTDTIAVQRFEPYPAPTKDFSDSYRTSYRCQKCGKPKRGHLCTVFKHTEISPYLGSSAESTVTQKDTPFYVTNPFNSTQTTSTENLLLRKEPSFYQFPSTEIKDGNINKVDCYVGWFDLAITSIDNLLTSIQSLNDWRKKNRFVKHLEEEKSYLIHMRGEYQVDRLLAIKDKAKNNGDEGAGVQIDDESDGSQNSFNYAEIYDIIDKGVRGNQQNHENGTFVPDNMKYK